MSISIFKNNSRLLTFTFKKSDGTAWNVPSGNILKFSVKKSVVDTTSIIEKSITGDGGNSYTVFLTGSDTNIPVGTYKYDIKDTTANLTYMEPTNFIIGEVVTNGDAITGSQNTEDAIVVTVDESVISLDYANLTNKPKINSVELSGNKSLADLDIQHELEAGDNIDITDNVISATDTVQYYYASDGLDLVDDDTFKVNIKDSEDVLGIDQGQLVINQSNINTSELNNDAGFLTAHQDISGKLDKITTTTSSNQVYVKKADGTQGMVNYGTLDQDSFIRYTSGYGQILVATTPGGYNRAASKQYVDNSVATKQTAPTIKTTLDSVLVTNSEYYLGSQSSLTLTLPNSANAGEQITVDFTSGTTATTLSISGNVAGDISYSPSANTLVEINFKYDGTYWKMLVSSVEIPNE